MAKIIAICGKICSGKTYYANQIKAREHAVLLSCDELTWALFDNDLGQGHDEMAVRIRNYFMKKSVELVSVGCTVILDWGFWTRAGRTELAAFYKSCGIPCEWHYIDVGDEVWQKSIKERNRRVSEGRGGSDYYLDEGLMRKLIAQWEVPARDEMDVWVDRK